MGCGLHCLKINDFSVYAGDKIIVNSVSMHAHCGELTAIIGGNGAGKSTLLRGFLGELKTTGTISFTGHDGSSGKNIKPVIGYVPQQHMRDKGAPITVFDLLHTFNSDYPVFFPRRRRDIEKIREHLKLFRAEHLIDNLVGSLSGGELQRVLLANAMLSNPDLLVLDEPVSGMDEAGLVVFYELIESLKKSHDMIILLVSHDLDYVYENADRLVLMESGKSYLGTPDEIFPSEIFKRSFPEFRRKMVKR